MARRGKAPRVDNPFSPKRERRSIPLSRRASMTTCPRGAKKAYYDDMNRRLLFPLLFLLGAAANAAEQLPDSADVQGEDEAAMRERLHTPPPSGEEMQNLYLHSPTACGNTEGEGRRSVDDDKRYTGTDMLFRDGLQRGGTPLSPPPDFDRTVPPPPPPSVIQQLRPYCSGARQVCSRVAM